MKILVVSDNHFDRDILVDLVDTYQGQVDLMLHCGDSEMDVHDPLFEQLPTVKGNNDFDRQFVNQRVVTQDQETILVTHGHLQNVNFTLENLLLLGKENQATMIFYGHTHQLAVEVVDHTLILNPGSISLPRGEYARIGGTFAIVESTPSAFKVQYYNRQKQAIPELNFKFSR